MRRRWALLAWLATATAGAAETPSVMPPTGEKLVDELLRSGARISINVPRAPIYGDAREPASRYCSPWVYARNSLRLPVRVVEIGIHFFDATGREVGASLSTHTNILPNDIHQRILTQVNSPACQGLRGEAVVQVCELEDGTDCRRLVTFSEFGFFPLRAAP
jgi:hypothetical protein